jgi:hypothetical protein
MSGARTPAATNNPPTNVTSPVISLPAPVVKPPVIDADLSVFARHPPPAPVIPNVDPPFRFGQPSSMSSNNTTPEVSTQQDPPRTTNNLSGVKRTANDMLLFSGNNTIHVHTMNIYMN